MPPNTKLAGNFLFVTRNPTLKNLFEPRFPGPQKYVMDDGTQLIATEQPHYEPITQIQHWTFHNQWRYPTGQQKEQTLRTALRYVFPQEMEALLFYNGFEIQACYGNWQQASTAHCLLPTAHYPPWRGQVAIIAKTPEEFESNVSDLFLDTALDGVILYDTNDYMAERLTYLRHLIQTQGLHREERGDELLWRWQEFPGFDWS